jgi:hypothetical protein
VRRSTNFPDRLRTSGATETEHRWLEAASREEPSAELRERMARGIGLSMAAVESHATGATPGTSAPAVPSAMATRTLVWWLSAGVTTIAAVGAVVALRGHEGAHPPAAVPSMVRSPATPIVVPPLPSATPTITKESTQAPASPAMLPRAAPWTRSQSRAEPPADDVAGQVALIDAARSALFAGMAARALDVLGQYQSRYPSGSFRPEATALRIEALAAAGRLAEARALAERFVSEHPGSPLADRVAREVGASPR